MKAWAVAIEQGSKEWRAWRNRLIGASEIAAVLGISPFLTARELFEIKIGKREQHENPAMVRGRELEDAAVFAVEGQLGRALMREGLCFEAEGHPLGASLDAFDPQEGIVYEVKCPGLASFERLAEGIPEHYEAQLQQQAMLAAGAGFPVRAMRLVVFHPDAGLVMHQTKPCDAWQERIVKAADEFWRHVEARQWPNDSIAELAEALAAAKAAEAEAVAMRKRIEAELIAAMQERGIKKVHTAIGIKASIVQRKALDKEAAANDPEWKALKEEEKALKARLKEIEAKYQKPGNAYIRLGGVA